MDIDKSLEEIFAGPARGGGGGGRGGRGRGAAGRGRGAKRGNARGGDFDSPNKRRKREDFVDQTNYIYINSESEVKKIAGTIAYSLRRGSSTPTLVCTGQTAINQAVKSLTICRSYLKDDGLDFKIYPEFQQNRERNDSIYLIVSPSSLPQSATLSESGAEVLTSSQKAKAKKIGGKIAHTIRKGKRVIVQAVGPGAVWRFVQSLLLAKNFVRSDNGLDLSFRSQFVILKRTRAEDDVDDNAELPSTSDEVNGLQFHVYAEQI